VIGYSCFKLSQFRVLHLKVTPVLEEARVDLLKVGSVDAYDRVLDGEHRKIVKQAFNAILNADADVSQWRERHKHWYGSQS
jgi:hypothetical protein